mgnify:CR=1 FL=1
MAKPFDISKFRKSITKSIDGLGIGFNDPTDWISTGNYTLNYLISGDFNKGIPLGKVTVFAGESGAGKSFICSGNVIKHAQEQGIYVILVDTENALDESWLKALGVDCDEQKLLKLNIAMIDDVAKTVSEFMMLGSQNVGMVCTNHTYASQDMFDPDDKISGGQGFIYASSIVVAMRKLKLKEDEDGNKVSEVKGIRAACKVMKTRYAKPFESVQVKIPYETGMSPYSGLTNMLESRQMLTKEGNSLVYKTADGEVIKKFRKAWEANVDGCLDVAMKEISSPVKKLSTDDDADTDLNPKGVPVTDVNIKETFEEVEE